MAFNILQWNCRGVISKWAEIKPTLVAKDCDAICLQETHFLPTDRYDFNLPNYTLYNGYSRMDRRQGGVCLYLRNKWPHFQVPLNTQLQAVACSVRIGTTRFTICSLYLPPTERLTFDDLSALCLQLPQPFMICADANSRHFLWGADRCDSRGNIWEQVIRRFALNVVNNGCPTRLDEYTGLWSHIDITLCTSDVGQYMEWHVDDDLVSSDHCPIDISYTRNQRITRPVSDTTFRWNLNKANWAEFSDKCDLQFNDDLGPDNCACMTTAILDAAKLAIPVRVGTGKYNCPWWNDDCKAAIRLRKRALNRFRRSRQNALLMEYKKAKAKARQVIRKAKKDSWQNFIDQFIHTTPISRLWDIIRRFTKKERFHRPLPVLRVGRDMVDDPLEVGNMLGQFFSDISSSDNYRPVFREHLRFMTDSLPDFSSDNDEVYNADFTLHELRQAISLSGNTSVGPDSLHYAFFKHMNDSQLLEILKLFNYIWRTGLFPVAWRHSTLIPILKPGKSGERVDSYRPIQLTSCLSKLMERIIAKRLAWYVQHKNMLSQYQSAFRKSRCTADHLIRFESEVRQGFFYNKYTLAVFLDLKSAYNLTSTVALLTKMYSLGFRGRLMTFLQGYLRQRTFQVHNSVLSDTFVQDNGLVQGGVLSPLLFNIMINDIFAELPADISCALFADDCSLWVQGRRPLLLIEKMQTALNSVCQWTDRWGFLFSPPKCHPIIFRRFMKARELENIPNLKVYDDTLTYCEEVKFLGVILDSRLNLHKHVQYVKARALKRMPILKCLAGRNCGADRTILLRLYKAMIRPILDYACQILDGPANKAIDSLDSVQNACIRIATGALRTSPIVPLLVDSDIYPLRLRRLDLTLRYSLKAMSDENHPCRILTTPAAALHRVDRTYMTRISGLPLYERLQAACDELGFILPSDTVTTHLSVAPWTLLFCDTRKLIQGKGEHILGTHVQSEFQELHRIYDNSAFIFTDGSKGELGVGCAFVHGPTRRLFRLPRHCSVFTAEAVAILRALEYVESNTLYHAVLCTDSLSVVTAVRHATSVHPTLIAILETVHRLKLLNYDLCLVWIPGHCGIIGNEQADKEAKRAMTLPDACVIPLSCTEYFPLLRDALRVCFNDLWAGYRQNTVLKAIKDVTGKWKTSCRGSRREEVVLCRLRLGHTRLTHSFILDHNPPPLCEHCANPLSVRHILVECPGFMENRLTLINACQRYGLPICLKSLLGDQHDDIIDSVFKYLRECHLLNRL